MDNQPPVTPAGITPPNVGPEPAVNPVTPVPTKKKSLLWLWITLPIVAVIGIAVAVFFMLFYPEMSAKGTATSFMTAVQNGDSAAIKQLADLSVDDAFIKTATDGLKGASFSVKNVVNKNSDGYAVNFTVSKSDTVKDATVLVKGSKVVNFATNTSATTGSNDSTTKSPTSQCLVASDMKAANMSYVDASTLETSAGSSVSVYLGYLFFQPDSVDFLNDAIADQTLVLAVNLHKTAPTKNFTITLQGFEHKTTATDMSTGLAKQRGDKIKNLLVARGVPDARISVLEPETSDITADATGEVNRRIDLGILIPESCKGANT